MGFMGRLTILKLLAFVLFVFGVAWTLDLHDVHAQTQPNIILVLTDDQRWDTLQYMPNVQTELIQNGVQFTNAFLTTPLCCPSRASILTGLYPHNHGLRVNWMAGFDDSSTIATWLHDAGYRTSYIGKYLNGYAQFSPYIPPGWDDWRVFVTPAYFNYLLNENGTVVSYGSADADYATDLLLAKVVDFIRSSAGQPFFLFFAPQAPHQPPVAARRHAGTFNGIDPWRPPNFNEADVSDKPAWVQALPLLSLSDEERIDKGRQAQLESLLAVDEAVASITQTLSEIGQEDNTVIIYTTDNGLLWGEHRWTATTTAATTHTAKEVPYEESVRAPLIIRYPSLIAPPILDDSLVLNIDLAPTIAGIADITPPTPVDGISLVPLLERTGTSWRQDFLIEYLPATPTYPLPEYVGVRTHDWKYVEYSTGDTELYDLINDPYELGNLSSDPVYADIKASLVQRLQRLTEDGPNQPPVANVIASPASGTAPLEVDLDGSNSSDPDGAVVNFDWDFGDGTTGSGVSIGHTYTIAGAYIVVLTVTDDEGAVGSASTLITVNATPEIVTTALPNGTVGIAYSQAFIANGGTAPLTWSLASGSNPLPDGLTLSTEGGISGTPTTVGTFSFMVQVTDADGVSDDQTLTLTVNLDTATLIFTTIDVPGASATATTGINDLGQIVGEFKDALGIHGFLRSSDGVFTTLDAPGAMHETRAHGINDLGQIVGEFRDALGVHGFLRSPDGVFTTLDAPGAMNDTHARGMNDLGQIVGEFGDALGVHGFLRSPDGVFTIIDAPEAVNDTRARGMNDLGQIVGYLSDGTGHRGFLRSPDGVFTLIDVPGATGTSAHGINDLGQIVGVFAVTIVSHGFLRSSDGVFISIDVPEADLMAGREINDLVQMVGFFDDATGGRHGVMAVSDLAVTTTLLLPGTVTAPYGQSLASTGGKAPYAWTVSGGNLPTGLALDPQSGVIFGMPTVAGTFSFTVRVTDGHGLFDHQDLVITVSDVPVILTTYLPDGIVSVAYVQILAASGGTLPLTWSLASGSNPLPDGLILSTEGGMSGTPSTVGIFNFTIRVTDLNGVFDDQDLTWVVNVDTVTLVLAVWDSVKQTLVVRATSSAAPSVSLTAVGFGDLKYVATTKLYQGSFQNITSNPGAMTVSSSGGGSASTTVRVR